MQNEFKVNIERFYLPIILVFAFVLYAQSFMFGFIYDDYTYIINNTWINGSEFTNIFDAFIPGSINTAIYSPLTVIYFGAFFKIAGANPTIFHACSLVVYLLSLIPLYTLSVKTLQNKTTAFFAVFLYALHPVHVECTAWITCCGYNLAVCFFCVAFNIFIDILTKEFKFEKFILFIFFFVLSLLSQPCAVIGVPLFVLWAFFFSKDKVVTSIKLSIIPFIASGIFVWGTYIAAPTRLSNYSCTLCDKLQIMGRNICHLFFPFDLASYYHLPGNDLFIIIFVAFLAILLFSLLKFKNKIVSFCILWFCLSILPYSNLFFLIDNGVPYDRYFIMPSIAICFMISYLCMCFYNYCSNCCTIRLIVYLRYLPALFFTLFFFVSSFTYLPIWENEYKYWNYNYAKEPNNFYTLTNCTYICYEWEDYEKTIELASILLGKYPNIDRGYYYYIQTMIKVGKYHLALDMANKMRQQFPDSDLTYECLSEIYVYFGMYKESLAMAFKTEDLYNKSINVYQSRLKYQSRLPLYRLFLRAYYFNGMCDKSVDNFKLAAMSTKDVPDIVFSAIEDYEKGDFAASAEKYEIFMTSLPSSVSPFPEWMFHIACLRCKYGLKADGILKESLQAAFIAKQMVQDTRTKEAELAYLEILKSDPFLFEANFEVGCLYFRQKKYDDSIKYLSQAYKCNPSRKEILELIQKCKSDMNQNNAKTDK